MRKLSMRCPKTDKHFSTGVNTDSLTLAKVWFSNIHISCPCCGEKHSFKIREAYIDAVLSEDRNGWFASNPWR
jgi:hypothetical protein